MVTSSWASLGQPGALLAQLRGHQLPRRQLLPLFTCQCSLQSWGCSMFLLGWCQGGGEPHTQGFAVWRNTWSRTLGTSSQGVCSKQVTSTLLCRKISSFIAVTLILPPERTRGSIQSFGLACDDTLLSLP